MYVVPKRGVDNVDVAETLTNALGEPTWVPPEP